MAKTVPVNKTIKKNSARVSGAEKASIKAGLKKHPNRKQKPIDKPSQKKRIQKTITLQPLSLEQQLAQREAELAIITSIQAGYASHLRSGGEQDPRHLRRAGAVDLHLRSCSGNEYCPLCF